jgi:hypothetical protein
VDEILATAEEWEQAGWDYLICGWPGEGRDRIEEAASRLGITS